MTTLQPNASQSGTAPHYRIHVPTWMESIQNSIDPRKDDIPLKVGLYSAVGEFIGTFLFVFFATAVVVAANYYGQNETLIIAFGQGFALALAIYVSAPVSGGHLNPAVTISVFLVRRISLIRALLYIFAQYAGAIAAAAVTYGIYPNKFHAGLGSTVVNPDISTAGAFFLELIMTFLLVFVMFGTAIDPQGVGKLAPLAIGLTVLIDELIGASFTGASMNPARTLGPALISNNWNKYWLYFFAPTIGASIAAILYEMFLEVSDEFRGYLPHQKAASIRRTRRQEQRQKRHEKHHKDLVEKKNAKALAKENRAKAKANGKVGFVDNAATNIDNQPRRAASESAIDPARAEKSASSFPNA